MIRTIFVAMCCSILGSATLADGREQAKALAEAIEDAGCVMTPKNSASILKASGLTEMEAAQAGPFLSEFGELEELSSRVFAFHSSNCSAQGLDADSLKFVSLIEDHGCRMTEEVAQVVMPETGFEKEHVKQIVATLVAKHLAKIEERELVLITENCR